MQPCFGGIDGPIDFGTVHPRVSLAGCAAGRALHDLRSDIAVSRVTRRLISLTTALAVGFAPLASARAASPAVPPSLTRAEYEGCQSKDVADLRLTLEAISARAIQEGLKRVDYTALVAEQWRKVGLDDILDKRIDATVEAVASEHSLWSKGASIFDREKAKELAIDVAERVYRSDDVKAGIDQLAVAAAREIGRSIELGTLDASEPTLRCLEAFVGPRYGTTIARVIMSDAAKLFEADTAKGAGTGEVGALSMSQSLTGVILVIARRQIAAMARRIGQRLVGIVLSRIAGAFAGGIGAILIAKDIWDWRNGVLPIVASEMKSEATKGQVRAEIAKALSEQIGEHTREIASATAERVVEIWRDFQRNHAKVVALADRHERFRRFIDLATTEQLPRIDELVAIVIAAEGEEGVLKRLDGGSLPRAVEVLDRNGLEVARDTRSLDDALGWHDLAGRKLGEVVRLGLHKSARPADLSRAEFERILSLGDGVAAARLIAIKPDLRGALLELDDTSVKTLARALQLPELTALSAYLGGLERPVAVRLLAAVAKSPQRMQHLGLERVRAAILGSRDQAAAVDMMLETGALLAPGSVARDAALVWDGRVAPILMWEKHPSAFGVAGVLALFLLLLVNRLLFGRRRRVVPA